MTYRVRVLALRQCNVNFGVERGLHLCLRLALRQSNVNFGVEQCLQKKWGSGYTSFMVKTGGEFRIRRAFGGFEDIGYWKKFCVQPFLRRYGLTTVENGTCYVRVKMLSKSGGTFAAEGNVVAAE